MKFPWAKKKFEKAIHSSFLNSHRWGSGKSWEIIEGIEAKNIEQTLQSYRTQPNGQHALSPTKPANAILAHLRNALAHGSIFTIPQYAEDGQESIRTIAFVSEARESQAFCGEAGAPQIYRYNLLFVSPDDFHSFLKNWIEFLTGLPLENDQSTTARDELIAIPSPAE